MLVGFSFLLGFFVLVRFEDLYGGLEYLVFFVKMFSLVEERNCFWNGIKRKFGI